jgi:Fe-S-cluster containining protein
MLIKKGQCKRCGKCCDWGLDGWPCKHLIPYKLKSGNILYICAIYPNRPEVCKEFPKEPGDLLPGCGFYFEEE